jgi:hypothetical protein
MTITASKVEDLYEQQIRKLSREEQIYLLKLIADALAAEVEMQEEKTHSVLEFEGAGAYNPIGMDAQEYINQMRDEWDDHPWHR